MDMLRLAIDAKLPFISVETEDLLYFQEIIETIAQKAMVQYNPANGETSMHNPDQLFFTSTAEPNPQFYCILEKNKSTCIWVNPPKKSVLFFDAGILVPPKEMVIEFLASIVHDEELANHLVNAFGGLSLKDIKEIVKLTTERDGEVTSSGVNQTRESYLSKLRGMVQIATESDFYQCPDFFKNWMDQNLPFFKKTVDKSLTPRGLLFDGRPGTGKTSGAKALAAELGVPLFRLDIAGMKNKYVGDSESNLNAALRQLDQMAPCVAIFDEIEKVIGKTQDSGVTSSMLSTLLWWLQEHTSQVFTIMTTNNKEIIPPELYREGRMDGVLTFSGLQTLEKAKSFAFQVYTKLADKVGHKVPFTMVMEDVMEDVKANFKDGPVSQSFVTGSVHTHLKASMLQSHTL